jgi:hypothetical protein
MLAVEKVKISASAGKGITVFWSSSPYTNYTNRVIGYLYGSFLIAFSTKQSTLIQSKITQVYFNLTDYLYKYTTCFGLYLGHSQACQCKNLTREDTIRIYGTFFYSHYFDNAKT